MYRDLMMSNFQDRKRNSVVNRNQPCYPSLRSKNPPLPVDDVKEKFSEFSHQLLFSLFKIQQYGFPHLLLDYFVSAFVCSAMNENR